MLPCLAEGLQGVTPSGLAALGRLPRIGGGLWEMDLLCIRNSWGAVLWRLKNALDIDELNT